MIKRQLNESDSLYAVQKMDFQLKLRELSSKYKSVVSGASVTTAAVTALNQITLFKLNDSHVPIVHVNNKFELFDATHPAASTVSISIS